MLLEIAVGDAYGAGFEYVEARMVLESNDLTGYVRHPRHGTPAGHYTDDTQMSLAIAEVIVEGIAWTPENIADKFVAAFHRDPREGYARGFQQFLTTVQSGREFLERIRPTSDKSGAAMRAAPIGVFPTVEEVLDRSTLQASLTHNTPDGIAAANAAALMSHYFIYRLGPKRELSKFLEAQVPHGWDLGWSGKVGSKGWMSVRAALTAIGSHSRLSDILKTCIDFGGDVDTVAAIAMGAASCAEEIRQDLPGALVAGLEDGPYGRSYLAELDRKLMALVRRSGTV